MCPDPALLVAYLDGTLLARDAVDIDRHSSGCERCAALLASMRYQRALARPASRWRSRGVAMAAGVVLAVGGLGVWAVLSGPRGGLAPGESVVPSASQPTGGGPDVGPIDSRPAESSPRDTAAPVVPAPPEVARPETVLEPPVEATEAVAPPEAAAPPRAPAPPVDVPSTPDPSGDGILLRARPNARVVWRVRDRTIERSADGGASWEVEHIADRPVRAGTFVSADVAWVGGEDGLVLRRTGNGWFGTNPPADAHIDAVRASGALRATVTLADGRVLSTENGGITWAQTAP